MIEVLNVLKLLRSDNPGDGQRYERIIFEVEDRECSPIYFQLWLHSVLKRNDAKAISSVVLI